MIKQCLYLWHHTNLIHTITIRFRKQAAQVSQLPLPLLQCFCFRCPILLARIYLHELGHKNVTTYSFWVCRAKCRISRHWYDKSSIERWWHFSVLGCTPEHQKILWWIIRLRTLIPWHMADWMTKWTRNHDTFERIHADYQVGHHLHL